MNGQEDVAPICNAMLLSHEKERTVAIWNNMDGLGGYYVKWNKAGRERQTVYDITYMWNLKKTNEYNKKRQIHRSRELTSDY